MHRPVALVALLCAAALAGCADSGGRKPTDDVDAALDDLGLKATDTTGVIRGVVVDQAIVPLANVSITVALDAVNKTVQSNDQGLFGIDGLPGGEYLVVASKPGYAKVQTTATVVPGESDPPTTRILLEVDAAARPFYDAYQYDAFIGCSVTSPSVSVALCDVVGPVKDATNNEFLVSYDAARPPTWVQSEAVWDSTQPTGEDLSLSLTDFSSGPQRRVNGTVGKSPIHITVNETVAREFNYGTNNSLVFRLFSTSLEGTDVVQESAWNGPYASAVYPALNGTGVPGAYQSTVVDSDPSGLVGNPFGSEECIKYPVLFDACYGAGGAGLVVNQRVSLYTHIFYGYTPPEGWRFSDTNAVPPPPA